MRKGILLGLLAAAPLLAAAGSMAQSTAQPVATLPAPPAAPEAITRRALLETARQPVEKELGKPVRFVVQQLGQANGWAFLRARMVGTNGKPISYAGTPLAEAAKDGGRSATYVALLRSDKGTWNVTTYAIGPTDVVWQGWPIRFRAPRTIFEVPESEDSSLTE